MIKLLLNRFMQNRAVVLAANEWQTIKMFIIITLSISVLSLLVAYTYAHKYSTYSKEKSSILQELETIKKERDEAKKELKRIADVASIIRKVGNRSKAQALITARLEYRHAKRSNIDYETGVAISWQESHFKPNVISYNGCCVGMKGIHHWWGKRFSFNPDLRYDKEFNIKTGYRILTTIGYHKKPIHDVLSEYYGHPDAAERGRYIKSVLSKRDILKRGVV